jgi:hypothetical protein
MIFAQKDSVNISFGEETVEKFEKTKLLDEYEKAFGGNKVVKSALKVGMTYGIQTFSTSILQAKFETKISSDKSLAIGINGPIGRGTFNVESRWYFKMKERVKSGLQSPNLTGEYLSLKYDYNFYPKSQLNDSTGFDGIGLVNRYQMFLPKAILSLNYGRQLGNNFDFAISVGIQQGGKSRVNNQQEWINDAHLGRDFNPFLSSKTYFGLGLNHPRSKKTNTNSCDFLMYNYKVKQLIKIPLNNLFYLDRYNQNLNLGIGYERKIANSAFSINSELFFGFNRITILSEVGTRQGRLVTLYDGSSFYTTIPLFSSKTESYFSANVKLNEQLRWYVGMNQRVRKGKSASNLNGVYTGLNFVFNKEYRQFRYNYNLYKNDATAGLLLGYQSKVSKSSYIDAGFTANLNERSGFYVKFGFAK